ncbi:PREDICTED: NADPH oxidase 5 [Thamnophis sirtalis]|uniref:NADPH oxidase 5 n=1 Tax=Thamnophis sirtalis TaxID=35019 RepID=A0A6I9Y1J7_9SAUR|nr:PREDICTED: NADPH oxidase 5 [Thamnophis sirtalis]
MNLEDNTKWLMWVAKQFENIAGDNKEINLEQFKTALKVKESFFGDRFFALFDSDESGTISLDELLNTLKLLIHGSETDKLRFLFQVYDVDDQYREPGHRGSSAASWLKPPTAPRKSQIPHILSPVYWYNNKNKLLLLGSYACVNIILFTLAALKQAGSGLWIVVARGCGQCLNFNCAFILVLMLRRSLTWLRTTWIAKVLPLDLNVILHQLMGYIVGALTLLHMGAHIINFVRLSQAKGGYRLWEYLFTTRPGIGWIHGTASLTGLLLQLLTSLMLVCSTTLVRRSGHFEVFYWTHLFYIPIWVLLIVHGANFWKWFVIPGSLFLGEKAFAATLSRVGGLYIVEVNLLPSKVTHLVIQRPPFLHYKPGDYVYLNIPVIARYEWHPFTISSAPEQPDTIWLHIRSLGQWTYRLHEYFWNFQEPLEDNPKLHRMRKEASCSHSNSLDENMKLQKVDFIWINRDQKSFEWFVSLLTQLEAMQGSEEPTACFLEMHLYMTSALNKSDMKAVGLQMALDLLAKKEKKDSITGLRTRTKPGRPDWKQLFQKIDKEDKGKVQVFFCGSPALAKVVKAQCEQFTFPFFRENF